jgi:hypothetical protein
MNISNISMHFKTADIEPIEKKVCFGREKRKVDKLV